MYSPVTDNTGYLSVYRISWITLTKSNVYFTDYREKVQAIRYALCNTSQAHHTVQPEHHTVQPEQQNTPATKLELTQRKVNLLHIMPVQYSA